MLKKSIIIESRTARAARYSEAPMLVGVMSVLASNVQHTEVVPRKQPFRPHNG